MPQGLKSSLETRTSSGTYKPPFGDLTPLSNFSRRPLRVQRQCRLPVPTLELEEMIAGTAPYLHESATIDPVALDMRPS